MKLNKNSLGKKTLALGIALSVFASGATVAYAGNTTVYFDVSKPVTVMVDGEKVDLLDCERPIIKEGRTMVPLRNILEQMGATVNYNSGTKTANITMNGKTISHKIGSDIIVKDGEIYQTEVSSVISNGRTMVPLRSITELLGGEVYWDNNLRSAFIWVNKDREPIELSEFDLKVLSYKHANLQNLERYREVYKRHPEIKTEEIITLGNIRKYDEIGTMIDIVDPEDYTQFFNLHHQIPENYVPSNTTIYEFKEIKRLDFFTGSDKKLFTIKKEVLPYAKKLEKYYNKNCEWNFSPIITVQYLEQSVVRTGDDFYDEYMLDCLEPKELIEKQHEVAKYYEPEFVFCPGASCFLLGRTLTEYFYDEAFRMEKFEKLLPQFSEYGFYPVKRMNKPLFFNSSARRNNTILPPDKNMGPYDVIYDNEGTNLIYVGKPLATLLCRNKACLEEYKMCMQYYKNEKEYQNMVNNGVKLLNKNSENYKLVKKI